jgi:hypothetical protein
MFAPSWQLIALPVSTILLHAVRSLIVVIALQQEASVVHTLGGALGAGALEGQNFWAPWSQVVALPEAA